MLCGIFEIAQAAAARAAMPARTAATRRERRAGAQHRGESHRQDQIFFMIIALPRRGMLRLFRYTRNILQV